MLAGNFRLLQDKTCLIGAKNYRHLPSLGATISLICTRAAQNKALFGESGLPELLQQSCHTAIELSSGGGPCWNRCHTLGTTLASLALPDLMLLNLGKESQKLLSTSSEPGWISTVPQQGKNISTTAVEWHIVLTAPRGTQLQQQEERCPDSFLLACPSLTSPISTSS